MDEYLKEMEWYYSTMTRQEAEDILQRCTKNTFLVRPSSQPGCFAVSLLSLEKRYFDWFLSILFYLFLFINWNNKIYFGNREIIHSLIVPTKVGYKWENDTIAEYPTVIDLILHSPTLVISKFLFFFLILII